MRIAFWSPNRRMGTTASMLAISAAAAWKMGKSCLLIQMYSHQQDLEKIFTKGMTEEERENVIREMGTDSLVRQFKTGMLQGEDVFNCSMEVVKNMSFLPASGNALKMMIGENARSNIIRKIISAAEEKFELVFIDTGNGREKEDLDILKYSDAVAAVCEQGRRSFIDIVGKAENMGIRDDKMFYIFTKYLAGSKYNINNLRHFADNVGNDSIGAIPLSYLYFDSIEDQKPMAFLQDFGKEPDVAAEPQFRREVIKCTKKLIDKAKKNERKRNMHSANGDAR
ncbi:MAG: hypothetical protein K6E85_09990 [Lachnospiraceae bacterium]|nr:hypothetical protein [Lachnospiraceae bacterium]